MFLSEKPVLGIAAGKVLLSRLDTGDKSNADLRKAHGNRIYKMKTITLESFRQSIEMRAFNSISGIGES